MDEVMPIGEFSNRSGLSVKRLRTYAANGLLAPVAVDPASGYRYYSPRQLCDARVIDALRQAGLPLADIRTYVSRPSEEQLNAWARRLEIESSHRRRALDLARQLSARHEAAQSGSTGNDRSEEAAMATLLTAGRSEKGPARERNEDVVVVNERLAIVADGMGGAPGGALAAAMAAGVVQASFTGRSDDELEVAVRAANWTIWDRARTNCELEGMGTTICAAGLLREGPVAVAHVGDSRAYLWRQNRFTQLTRDHSVTAELVERGELREEDAASHPHYGVLTRALGVGPDLSIEHTTLTLREGDRIVVCSDGLFNELSSTDIAEVLARGDEPCTAVDELVERGLARGARDNVSVAIAQIAA